MRLWEQDVLSLEGGCGERRYPWYGLDDLAVSGTDYWVQKSSNKRPTVHAAVDICTFKHDTFRV